VTVADAFEVIYADPPWRYDNGTPGREIERHYPTMTQQEICALPVPVARNAVLFLWAVSPKLPEALDVMAAWGFTYRSSAVWDKEFMGMGYWFRGQHELLLVGVRGQWSPPPQPLRVSSVYREARGRHSRKPDTVRNMIAAWAAGVEAALRAHLGHSRVVRARVAASGAVRVNYLDRSVTYLREWLSALLAAPFALDAGRQALELARRAERAAGLDRLVHHLPVPCPSCDMRTLTREDGAEQVECRACGDVWPEDTYRRLTLVLASDYRDVAGVRSG
jgi:N6-adenosine-specific RNA methylase IME4